MFGQDFSGRSPASRIGEQSQLGGSVDDVLGLLDAAGEAAGCAGLLVIDALNESESPKWWQDDLRVLAAAVRRYPHVAVVVSCRSEYLSEVVGDAQLPQVEHSGFGEATGAAVKRYASAYGIELPTFPLLDPEFSKPLYLKLTCRAVQTLGATRFPLGAAGLTTVVNAFIDRPVTDLPIAHFPDIHPPCFPLSTNSPIGISPSSSTGGRAAMLSTWSRCHGT